MLRKTIIGLVCSVAVFCLAGNIYAADSFVAKLQQSRIIYADILTAPAISRYDTARILNALECQDCLFPAPAMRARYIPSWREPFQRQAGIYLDDVKYAQNIYQGKSYYYCVAYAADKNYVRGYTPIVSPVCPYMYCGTKSTTYGEYLQIVINMLGQHIYTGYVANRGEVKSRSDQIVKTKKIEDVGLDRTDIQTITTASASCRGVAVACPLTSYVQRKTRMKYCTYNIHSCQMKNFGNLGTGYWPIAQINVASKLGILDMLDATKPIDTRIHDAIPGKVALMIAQKVFPYIACSFDGDYDCDGKLNTQDTCPYIYNPRQMDTDKDTIGDVCDPDIDNDTIPNPINIVDDGGYIDISKRTTQPHIDACLFVPGEVCDDMKISGLAVMIASQDGKIVASGYPTGYTDLIRSLNTKPVGYGASWSSTKLADGIYTIGASSKKYPAITAQTDVVVSEGVYIYTNPMHDHYTRYAEQSDTMPGISYPRQVKRYDICTLTTNAVSIVTRHLTSLDALCLAMARKEIAVACDMDGDGIDNRCDTDIDGDGKSQPLGLIPATRGSCILPYKYMNASLLNILASVSSCSMDSCPFDASKTSVCFGTLDNANALGTTLMAGKDSDKDGIPDVTDQCPLIAENYNGLDDSDGCPELDTDGTATQCTPVPSTAIGLGTCRQCPCQFAGYAGDIVAGDTIRATLYNLSGNIYQTSSVERVMR